MGVRTRPLDPIELEANVTYVDLSDAGDTTSFGIGGYWYFTPQVAFAVTGAYSDDVESFSIGFRGTWGRNASARLTAAVCDPGKPPWPGAVHGSGLAHG